MKACRYLAVLASPVAGLLILGGDLPTGSTLGGSRLGTHLVASAARAADETPKDMIASQVRREGSRCDNPKSATRDQALSKPDEAVWVLTCENATYRVRLIPDMAAKIEKLQGQK